MGKRALAQVPTWVKALLVLSLGVQVAWRAQQPPPLARADQLPAAPDVAGYRLSGLGDPLPLAQATMMWLQAFDRQPGLSLSFRDLDYAHVEGWLSLILQLDPRSQYPLLMAARVYGEIGDPPRQRQMLEFVERQFGADPVGRWPHMAHAAIVAKHKLQDLPLALRLARQLRVAGEQHPRDIPAWARQMEIAVLEDMGQDEAARILIGGLLQSGKIRNTVELRFLEERLQASQASQAAAAGRR